MRSITLLGLAVVLAGTVSISAQDELLQRLETISPIVSQRKDISKLLGDGELEDNSVWYYEPKITIEVVYSDGKCTEGWLAKQDSVVEVSAFFVERRSLDDLTSKVTLSGLRYENAFDAPGERVYYDDKRGVAYRVNEREKFWMSVRYYPSRKFDRLRCKG